MCQDRRTAEARFLVLQSHLRNDPRRRLAARRCARCSGRCHAIHRQFSKTSWRSHAPRRTHGARMNRYQKMSDAAKSTATPEEIETETAEGVKMESIDWLWDKRFALGKLGLIGGNPERG